LGLAKVTTVKKFSKNKSLCTCSGVAGCYVKSIVMYEGWNFNSGNYLFTTDTK